MTVTQERKLSERQRYALERAHDKGSAFGGRAGGAYARMCQRLADYGLLTSASFELTEEGRRALDQCQGESQSQGDRVSKGSQVP